MEKSVKTMFYFKCSFVTIQLSVFYTRGEFYWIGNDNTKQSEPHWFGDLPRGINK